MATEKSSMLSCPAQIESKSKKKYKGHHNNNECSICYEGRKFCILVALDMRLVFLVKISSIKLMYSFVMTKSFTTLGGESEILGGKSPP